MIKRRQFIAGLGSAAAWPVLVRAQQGERVRRIGVLMNGAATAAAGQSYVKSFIQALGQSGWVDGQNVRVDMRWSAGDATLARLYAAQLIGLMPDVIFAVSTTNLMAIREATNAVPVVFSSVSDPVEQGFVASLTKPGGNITGFTAFEFSIGGKWLSLRELAPGLTRVAVMFNPDTSAQSKFFMRSIDAAGSSLGIAAMAMPVRNTADIEPSVEKFAGQSNGGLVLPTDSFTVLRYQLIADLASRYGLPSIGTTPEYATDGGLMYYGVRNNLNDQFRQAASYVDRILKGEKPADLPVQQPTKFEFVINLKTAKALGLTIPETLLATADEVIQ
jgi:putative ABC transport system substrate-binding protein